MLDTLIKIGKWQSSEMEPIERFLAKPKRLNEDKINYVLNLIFDLDKHDIYTEILKKFDKEKDPYDLLLIKILPGNNKSIYVSVEKDKLNALLKSFFGKIDLKDLPHATHGELLLKATEIGVSDKFASLLDKITELKDILIEKITKENENGKIDPKLLMKDIHLKRGEDIVMVVASVRSKEFGFEEPVPIALIDDYKDFVNNNFLKENTGEDHSEKALCYATGEYYEDVSTLNLEVRYSLNKMFVTETKNYATGFNKNHFIKNYKVSKTNQAFLDLSSRYLLDNYKTTIAGIPHVIIPVFFSKDEVEFDLVFEKINGRCDFLFKYNTIKQLDTNITDWTENEFYWLNFLSIDSDGNYFKSNNLIKDVSKPWFLKLIETLDKINNHFSERYDSNTFYNFYSFYSYIPVKNALNKNEALELFKDIFEHRRIDKNLLFKYFTKYLIVQRSGQFDEKGSHRAYNNIKAHNEFDYAIKNGILTYLAFIQFLRNLNLLNTTDMEENAENVMTVENAKSDYGRSIENFFSDMKYNATQKALFYLGRVLNQVAYAQVKSNHPNKPILNKLNYNGMDKDAVIRLHLDLAEKVRQYVTKINLKSVEFNLSRFTELFNPNNPEKWLTPEENVFYILSGYSFGMISEPSTNDDEDKNIENNN